MKLSLLFSALFTLLSSNAFSASLENRENKNYQLAVGVGNEYTIAAMTLSAGYFLNSSEVITFRYASITRDDESEAQSNEAEKLKSYTLGYKRFLGNSFNIQPTVYYRRSSIDFVNEGAVKSFGTPNLTYDDMGVGFRIGNEWQWDNFVLGVDWFGINRTVYKINSEEKWQGSPQSINFKKGTTLTITSFYLGASF